VAGLEQLTRISGGLESGFERHGCGENSGKGGVGNLDGREKGFSRLALLWGCRRRRNMGKPNPVRG
jgi:hypothetical protein